jgi:hypothetical protein
MKNGTWTVQDAKARFGELLEACVSDGPQVVTANVRGFAHLNVDVVDPFREPRR